MATDTNAAINMTKQSIADGTLTVKQRAYGYRDDPTGGWWRRHLTGTSQRRTPTEQPPARQPKTAPRTPTPTLITAKFDLAAMAEKGAGAATTINGPKWIDQVIATLTEERDLLSTLQSLDSADTQSAEVLAWQRVQFALQYLMLGNLPMKMDDAYGDLESEVEAIDLINRALDALSSNANLAAALDPDGTGIFDHYDSGEADVTTTPEREDQSNFVTADGKVNKRTPTQMRGEKTHQVIATLGTTSYTRFGVWRRAEHPEFGSHRVAWSRPTAGPARSPTARWTRRMPAR